MVTKWVRCRAAKALSELPREDVANIPRFVCKCGPENRCQGSDAGRACPYPEPSPSLLPQGLLMYPSNPDGRAFHTPG